MNKKKLSMPFYSNSDGAEEGGLLSLKNDTSPFWEIEGQSADIASQIADLALEDPLVQEISSFLSPAKIRVYLEKKIKVEIRPSLRSMALKEQKQFVSWKNHGGLGEALARYWPSRDVTFCPGPESQWHQQLLCLMRQMKSCLQLPFGGKNRIRKPPLDLGPKIAVAYREGLEFEKRCDLYWYPSSQINPSQILIFFDGRYPKYLSPVSEETLKKIEQQGINWVCIRGGSVTRKSSYFWEPGSEEDPFPSHLRAHAAQRKKQSGFSGWIGRSFHHLLDEVRYWHAFYKAFGIRIHFETEEGNDHNIAQCLAMDLLGGLLIGKQRSQLYNPRGSRLGFDQKHLFFSWSGSALKHLMESRNQIDCVIVSGYPNDYSFVSCKAQGAKIRQQLEKNGVRFAVALFDNMFDGEHPYTHKMMVQLYEGFLQWVLEDKTFGLILKTKKPEIIEKLPQIHRVLTEAERTGRCLRLDFVPGQLPTVASSAADFSVGIGLSSAVLEAAIAGKRGIHWDPAGMDQCFLVPWGKGKVLFRELPPLLEALKRYKQDPHQEPSLGDFSSVLSDLDPFRDGRAGKRVGNYLHDLLKSYDAGWDRSEAILRANSIYTARWGEDKVIQPEFIDAPKLSRVASR